MIYKRIENKHEKYDSLVKSLSWDSNNTYSQDNYIGIDWLFDKMIGVYDEDKLIALGNITPYFDDEYKKSLAYLSSIVKKEYRNQGISKELLKHMLDYCKDLQIKKVTIEILKTNIISLRSIKNENFDFVEENDKVLIYEKKLNNKQ